jgi:hypothetical protein
VVLNWGAAPRGRGSGKSSQRSGGTFFKRAPQVRRADPAKGGRRESEMNSDQVALIPYSFAKIMPIAEEAAATFDRRLFAIAPEVKQLLHGDVTGQGRKLMATLAVVVNGLAVLALAAASALARSMWPMGSGGSTARRRGAVVDAGMRTWSGMGVRPRGRLDERLHDLVRIHD